MTTHTDNTPEQDTYDALMSDRKQFDAFVYTPLEDAIVELRKRRGNTDLISYIKHNIHGDIPNVMQDGGTHLVLFRHIATPNHEIRRFVGLADLVQQSFAEHATELRPLILEYLDDMFTNRNDWKYSLGRFFLYKGLDKNSDPIFEAEHIIDFNQSNGKPISSISTHWEQNLVDFHHELFFQTYPNLEENVYDISWWVKENGKDARTYYKAFLSLFLTHGILFENFLLETSEGAFTRNVILPTLLEIQKESGFKPLIVALEPTEIEHQRFWLSHPHKGTYDFLKKKQGGQV